jgi:hypothetical protein
MYKQSAGGDDAPLRSGKDLCKGMACVGKMEWMWIFFPIQNLPEVWDQGNQKYLLTEEKG